MQHNCDLVIFRHWVSRNYRPKISRTKITRLQCTLICRRVMTVRSEFRNVPSFEKQLDLEFQERDPNQKKLPSLYCHDFQIDNCCSVKSQMELEFLLWTSKLDVEASFAKKVERLRENISYCNVLIMDLHQGTSINQVVQNGDFLTIRLS